MSAGSGAVGEVITGGSEPEPDGLSRSSWLGWLGARAASFGPAVALVLAQQVLFPVSSGIFVRGLIIGALTALIALGMALIYRANRIINFAQAHMGYAPALLAFLLMDEVGLPYLVAVGIGLVAAVALGAATERVVIRRFERAPRLLVTVATLGLSQLLAGLARLLPSFWDRQILSGRMPAPFEVEWTVGGVRFDVNDLLGLTVAPLAVLLVALFLQRSDTGVAIRASADSAERAELLGVPVHRLQTIVWSLAAALAFTTVFLRSGILGLPIDAALAVPTIGAGFSLSVLLRSLVALLLGRMTNLVGVASAAVALGVLEQGIERHHGDALIDPILGVVVVIALVLRRREVGRADAAGDTAWRAGDEARPIPPALWEVRGVQVARWATLAAVAVVALLLPWVLPADQTFEASTLLIYALLGLSLVLLSGWGGLVSLGHMAYFAVGAAVAGWAVLDLGLDLLPAMLLATAAGAAVAAVVGIPALRLRGLYLAVTSFAFALAATGYLLDEDRFGWVPEGRVERTSLLGGFGLSGERAVYYLVLVVLVLVLVGLRNVHASRFGRALVALRENDRAAEAYAVDTVRVRLAAFALSGAIAALAGALFVHHESGYHAGSYGALENLEVFTMVVIGGMTSVVGAVVGALYLWGTRWFLPSEWAVVVAGTGVLAVLVLCPGGLASIAFRLRDRLLRTVAARGGLTISGYSRQPATSPGGRDPRRAADVDGTEGRASTSRPDPTVPTRPRTGDDSPPERAARAGGRSEPVRHRDRSPRRGDTAGGGRATTATSPARPGQRWPWRRRAGLADHARARPTAGAVDAVSGGRPTSASEGARSLLAVRGVEVAYGGVPVLFGVDLDVREGEAVALLGTNGAGKSTLLRAVSGLVPPVGGQVVFGGEDVTGRPAHEVAARGVLQMPGGQGVFPTLTVAENLRVAGWLHRRDRTTVAAGTERVLRLFPVLADRAGDRAATLSGGQQQMLALGMTMLGRPRLLMIDELSLGLAPAVTAQLLRFVDHLRDEGITLLVVEQSVNVALEVADRAVFMEHGQVRFAGPTADLLDRPDLLRSVFLGSAEDRVTAARTRAEVEATALTGLPEFVCTPGPFGYRFGSGPATRDRETGLPDRAGDVGGATEAPAEDGPVVRTVGVSVAFGGVVAVEDVSVEVGEGEIVGVIGPNGAGKTTLLNLLSGYVRPDRGRILLDGRDVTRLRAAARARRGLGRSFQDARLFPALTVEQTIATALERWVQVRDPLSALVHLPNVFDSEQAVQRRVDELVELLNLGDHRGLFVAELSTGTRRVVELACLLAHRPRLVLLDEPAAGIAQAEVTELAPLLRRIRDEMGAGLVIVEHDIPLVEEVADRLVALDRGRVLRVGPAGEVLSDPEVVDSYLGGDSAGTTPPATAATGASAPGPDRTRDTA